MPSSNTTAARGCTPAIPAGTMSCEALYTVMVTSLSLPGGRIISCCTSASPPTSVCTATGSLDSAALAAACSSSFHSGAVFSAFQLGFFISGDQLQRP